MCVDDKITTEITIIIIYALLREILKLYIYWMSSTKGKLQTKGLLRVRFMKVIKNTNSVCDVKVMWRFKVKPAAHDIYIEFVSFTIVRSSVGLLIDS